MRLRIVSMQLVLAVAASTLMTLAEAQSRSAVETFDLMPLYWQFWERAQGLPVAEQVRLIREMVVERRPEVYNASVMNLPAGKSFAEMLPEIYPKATAWTSPHVGTMRTL